MHGDEEERPEWLLSISSKPEFITEPKWNDPIQIILNAECQVSVKNSLIFNEGKAKGIWRVSKPRYIRVFESGLVTARW